MRTIVREGVVFYFFVNSSSLSSAVNEIVAYFQSYESNKRRKIEGNEVVFNSDNILGYEKIIHSDFDSWKKKIECRL